MIRPDWTRTTTTTSTTRSAVYNASICRGELTARVDWWYDGEPLIDPGHVRHTAMFLWTDEVDEAAKAARRFDEVRRLGPKPGSTR